METFREVYESRREEINDFLEMIEFLQKKKLEQFDSDDIESEFDKFFKSENGGIEISYSSMINILKSNVSLMLYNYIEFSVSGLIEVIYEKISNKNLSYVDVNDSLQAMWRKSCFNKQLKDPNSNVNTYINMNEQIITDILERKTLEFSVKHSLSGGNLGAKQIEDTCKNHGIDFRGKLVNEEYGKVEDELKKTKNYRNNLAHGSVSFVEALRNDTISDVKNRKQTIFNFLDNFFEVVEDFINNEKYKSEVLSCDVQ